MKLVTSSVYSIRYTLQLDIFMTIVFSHCTMLCGIVQGKLPLRDGIFRICKKCNISVTSVGLLLQGYVHAITTVFKVWFIYTLKLGVSHTSYGSVYRKLSHVTIGKKKLVLRSEMTKVETRFVFSIRDGKYDTVCRAGRRFPRWVQ
jgi:hypothetical protein